MKTETIRLLAPVSGISINLQDVPDQVFSKKLVGDGLAIDPTTEVLVAPCDGIVKHIHPSKHALTLETGDGVQILMHIGLETVQLKGEGFTSLVRAGAAVRAGEKLISFDADFLAAKVPSLMTIMIVTEPTGLNFEFSNQSRVNAGEDFVISFAVPSAKGKTEVVKAATFESDPITVSLESGLHARPAALIANRAKSFEGEIWILKGAKRANAKSVVKMMELEIAKGDFIRVTAAGSGADKAVNVLFHLISALRDAPEPHAAVTKTANRKPSESIFCGTGISNNVAVGHIFQVHAKTHQIQEFSVSSQEEERRALLVALKNSMEELKELNARTKSSIFTAHLELLDDPELLKPAEELIASGRTAAYAWNRTIKAQATQMERMKNELLSQRAVDLQDIGDRVLKNLTGTGETEVNPPFENAILLAHTLTPSQTARLDRNKIVGFCTATGSATSHVAILARSLQIPAVCGIDAKAFELVDGAEVIIDGERGELRIHPSMEEKLSVLSRQKLLKSEREAAILAANHPAVMLDGGQIAVHANIGSAKDAQSAVELGAEGVGLLRTEFLFLEREHAPDENEQHAVYQKIADILDGRPLTIRTLDIGGDKPLKYLPLPKEENPFLGVRGLRVSLAHPEMFRQQLRAILRVRSKGPLNVMFPMVTTLEEVREAKRILESERSQLKVDPVNVGIMVEVPAVALMADAFAREVDFFSVGTNDLTQYTLAMDRGQREFAKDTGSIQASVLKLIQMSTEAAHAHGKWIGVCGGLASDPEAVPLLIGLGVDEISVSYPSIPQIKNQIRQTSRSAAQNLVQAGVLKC